MIATKMYDIRVHDPPCHYIVPPRLKITQMLCHSNILNVGHLLDETQLFAVENGVAQTSGPKPQPPSALLLRPTPLAGPELEPDFGPQHMET